LSGGFPTPENGTIDSRQENRTVLTHILNSTTGLFLLGAIALTVTAGSAAAAPPIDAAPGSRLIESSQLRPTSGPGSPTNLPRSDVWMLEPSGTTAILSDLWGTGHELLTVGAGGTILYFDGVSWQPLASGSTADLQGVWGNTLSDVYAVGPGGTVLHFTGTHWHAMATPTDEFLRGVWGTSHTNVFVTGTRGTIIRFDGGRWSAMESGSPNRLYDIWGSAEDDAFVTGHLATILHYDGVIWSAMNSGVRPTLWGVWGAASDDVFAVGGGGVIIRFDGGRWSAMDSGTTEDLYRVWGAAPSMCGEPPRQMSLPSGAEARSSISTETPGARCKAEQHGRSKVSLVRRRTTSSPWVTTAQSFVMPGRASPFSSVASTHR
jgi:hypothetical protein